MEDINGNKYQFVGDESNGGYYSLRLKRRRFEDNNTGWVLPGQTVEMTNGKFFYIEELRNMPAKAGKARGGVVMREV